MSEIKEKLVEEFGENAFISKEKGDINPLLMKNEAKKLVFVLIRETIGPFIVRSDVPEETITTNIEGRNVVEVPARKFKSREKMAGIRFLRLLKVMPESYIYNEVNNRNELKNPTSILMGDTIVKGNDAGKSMIPSRLIYSHSYSIRDKYQITEVLQHNQLGDNGTTIDSEGKNKTGLFLTEYVKPGVFFPSFLVLQNPTPELFFHTVVSLKASSYGAQTAITGSNIKNHIIGILSCKNEPPVTSYTISRDFKIEDRSRIDRDKLITFIVKEILKNKTHEEDTFFLLNSEATNRMINEFKGIGGIKVSTLDINSLIFNKSVDQIRQIYAELNQEIDEFFSKIFPKTKPRRENSQSGIQKSIDDEDQAENETDEREN